MAFFGSQRIVCTCVPLGCATEIFEFGGQTHQGRLFHRTNYKRHEENSIAQSKKTAYPSKLAGPNKTQTEDEPVASTSNRRKRARSSSTSSTQDTNYKRHQANSISQNNTSSYPSKLPGATENQSEDLLVASSSNGRKWPISSSTGSTQDRLPARPQKTSRKVAPIAPVPSAPPTVFTSFTTRSFVVPLVFLQNKACVQSMFQVLYNHFETRMSVQGTRRALVLERDKVKRFLVKDPLGFDFSTEIPLSLDKLISLFGLSTNILNTTCCYICGKLHGIYNPKRPPTLLLCNNQRFPSQKSKDPQIECKYPLYKRVGSGATKTKPCSTFYHQSLTEWIAKMLSFPHFEEALQSPLEHRSPPNGVMKDIWDGQCWRTFKYSDGTVFTRTPGNIVFGFYGDWFNPWGKSRRRGYSAGVKLLICFNLPPNIRYRSENIFLYAITPGPRETHSDQIPHFLEPLLTELGTLWSGIRFDSTSLHPQGRLIRVALWPLIADIPAMKKLSGFSGHSSTNFCSQCYITLDDIDEIDMSVYKDRHPVSYKAQSQTWLDATSAFDCNELVRDNGVRYTPFSDLPYWNPIKFPTIDIMHCLVLGLLESLSTAYLQIPSAGKKLKITLDKQIKKGVYNDLDGMVLPGDNSDPPVADKASDQAPSTLNEGLTDVEMFDGEKTPSSNRSHYPRSAKTKSSKSSSIHSQTSRDTVSSSGSQSTVQPQGPAVTTHELQLIHQSIRETIIPSWMTRVPRQIGMASAGSPKAAEWLALYTVFMVLSLIPYHHNTEENSSSWKIHRSICLATEIINLALSRVMSPDNIHQLDELLVKYRTHLQLAWPDIKSKPNIHYAQHLSKQIRLFGPASYTSAWCGERMIGTLVSTPKNSQKGE